MAKMFNIHELELRPGVTAEEFERFMTMEYMPIRSMPAGWSVTFMGGNRGEREGKYALVFEVASVEARDRFFPESGIPTAEAEQWSQQYTADQRAAQAKMSSLVTGYAEHYTDYAVIAG